MNYPFEIHLTVKCNPSPFDDPQALTFNQACERIGVKPLVVELGNMAAVDVMTSSKIDGTFTQALLHAIDVTDQFTQFGMTVIRTKIETTPWHPSAAAPTAVQYFESHLAVEVTPSQSVDNLRETAAKSGCHTSRNAFKVYPDHKVIMVTKRDSKCLAPEFIQQVDEIRKVLTDSDYKVGHPIVEFVIYDSNQAHDDAWVAELDLSQNNTRK